jgi:hypothetical protein
MDELLVELGVAVTLVLALVLALVFLLARAKKDRRQRQAASRTISVAELVENTLARGEPIRLNWAEDDLDAYGRVRPSAQDELPTGILPKFKGTYE